MLDTAIVGGTVIDGTGGVARRADVGIRDGRVVAVGELDESATRTVDAADLVVTPGFVDPHTHYDAQLFWDPLATPSSWHGVTSVIGGNCGFTIAPLKERDADYTRRLMERVEGMPLAALEQGVRWTWDSFGEFLDAFEGNIAVNAGFMVGHCALRRYVMEGDDTRREATPDELTEMIQLMHRSLAEGGLGLSTSRSNTHLDGDGQPVPSRYASEQELLALCDVVGEHPGTSIEAITSGCIAGFDDGEVELFAQMSARAGRPLNWNVLAVAASDTEKLARQLLPSARAREIGGRVVALSMPVPAPMCMSLNTFCALWLIPGWDAVLRLPKPEKARMLQDPAVRADLMAQAGQSALGGMTRFGGYIIGDTYSTANEGMSGRRVREIAAERGIDDDFEALVGIVLADDFRTVLWPRDPRDNLTGNLGEDFPAYADVWQREDVLLGGSDGGAHLDRMCGAPYVTRFLGDCLRGRQVLGLERAVQLISDAPARLYGLRDRGRIAEGSFADVVVLDPTTVDAGPPTLVHDLPGGSVRMLADPVGVHRVFVNGVETVTDGSPTGATAGTVLRSGRNTDTVSTR
jgi:N-acyl-D-aspartate/D-glutamate deacylase